jgi:hypothetical protein
VRLQSKGLKLLRCRLSACGILATVEVSGDRQAGLSFRGPDKIQDLLVAVERFAGPVLEISEKSRCSMGFHLEAPVG